MAEKKKKVKKKLSKQKRLVKLRKKILLTWSLKVRDRDNHTCTFCGAKTGELNKNNKKIINNAHHCLSKNVKNSPLKYDIRNGITLCPEHHKFSGTKSAHKAPIIFYHWMQIEHPVQYNFVLENAEAKTNLSDEDTLLEILSCLEEGRTLDLVKIAWEEHVKIPKETILDQF